LNKKSAQKQKTKNTNNGFSQAVVLILITAIFGQPIEFSSLNL